MIGEIWGLIKQALIIWRRKSGLAVSNSLFIYLTFMFAGLFVYGWYFKLLVVVLNY